MRRIAQFITQLAGRQSFQHGRRHQLELIDAFAAATGINVPYRIMPRRAGDVDSCFANPAKARQTLGWRASRTIQDMCKSAWLWQHSLHAD